MKMLLHRFVAWKEARHLARIRAERLQREAQDDAVPTSTSSLRPMKVGAAVLWMDEHGKLIPFPVGVSSPREDE